MSIKDNQDKAFIDALQCISLTLLDGCVTNHGLTEYGARKLLQEGREPSIIERKIVLDSGTIISYEDWKNENSHS